MARFFGEYITEEVVYYSAECMSKLWFLQAKDIEYIGLKSSIIDANLTYDFFRMII